MCRWFLSLVVPAAALVFAVGAFAGSKGAEADPDSFVAAVPGGLGGVISDWDPATMYDPSLPAMSQLYERLTRYDADARKLRPELATSWSSTQGGRIWTFKLRKNVKFHSGRALTSRAVKDAVMRTKRLGKGAAYIWDGVKSISTPNPNTVVFHLKGAAPLDLASSSDYGAFIYDTKAAGSDDLAKWFAGGKDAGTGPYTVQTYQPGRQVELVLGAFDDYWGGWTDKNFKRAVYLKVSDPGTAAQLAKSGEVNFVQALTPQVWKSFVGEPGFSAPARSSLSNMFLLFNTKSGPLANRRVRQAVAQGIDYNAILKVEGSGFTRPPGIVPKGVPGYFANIPQYKHDPAKARRLLAAAGSPKVKLTLNFNNTHPDQELAAGIMKSSLAAIGVDLIVRGLAGPAVVAIAQSKNPSKRQDMSFLYWEPDYPDAWNFFAGLFKSADPPVWNWGYYDNAKFDAALTRSATLIGAPRTNVFRALQLQLHRDVPGLVLYTVGYARVLSKGIRGYVDNPSYPNVVFVHDLTRA